jgi:cell wall-associated NlpC family hydrolase
MNPWLIGGAVLLVGYAVRAWTKRRDVVATALRYLGVPYSLGGSSMSEIDCSGLTKNAYAVVGVTLPRRARDQRQVGVEVPLGSLVAGDLVYWARDGAHDHVGIYDGAGGVINASSIAGEVVVDRLATWISKGWASGARRFV